MRKVAILLVGDIKHDGRVLKEIGTLQSKGLLVELIVSRFIDDSFEHYPFAIQAFKYPLVKNPMINLLNQLKFCIKAYRFMKKNGHYEFIHCNDLNTLFGGFLYKRKYKTCKLIYDAHELYPEMQTDRIRRTFWNFIEKRLIKQADIVICPEKNRANYLKTKYHLEKVELLENFPKHEQFPEENFIERDLPETKGKKKILYIGVLMDGRNIEAIINSAEYLPEKYVVVFIGKIYRQSYGELIKQQIRKKGLSAKVYLRDPINNRDVLKYINSSDIGFAFYQNSDLNNYYCASNKLYEFITCKKAVITNDYPGLIEVVAKNNYGICLSKITDQTIAQAIKKIDGQELKFEGIERFYWETQEQTLARIYE